MVIELFVCVVKSLSSYWINFLLSPWIDFSSHQYFASSIIFSKVFIACQWQTCFEQNYSSPFMVQDSEPEFLDKNMWYLLSETSERIRDWFISFKQAETQLNFKSLSKCIGNWMLTQISCNISSCNNWQICLPS
jgi:hypothetical protein